LNFLDSYSWCSLKDDYRTLVGLEGVNVVNSSDNDIDEEIIECIDAKRGTTNEL